MPKKKEENLEVVEVETPAKEEAVMEVVAVESSEPVKHTVFIPSNLVAYQSETKDGKTTKFMVGSVNGRKFKVLCDSQQEVSEDVFEALKPLLKKMAK